MELFIVRHGIAEDGPDDDARALTKKGRERFEKMVELLQRLEVRVDVLLHSPKRRAVETAELMASLVHGRTQVTELLTMAPSARLLALLTGDRCAVVGHEPHLSSLLSWLVAGDSHGLAVELKKGAVAHLEGSPEPGRMVLRALLPPRVGRA